MHFAILTRNCNRSPEILAQSAKLQLEDAGLSGVINYNIDFLNRLVPYNKSRCRLHFWLKRKVRFWFKDYKTLKQLRKANFIIVSECSPNAFWQHLYGIERLKQLLNVPVVNLEVYHLENAPTQYEVLLRHNQPLLNRYDFHLFVSPVTEIKQKKPTQGFCIGLLAHSWNITTVKKSELFAIIDFAQSGYEPVREMQMRVLKALNISYVSLEGEYTISEIRSLYKKASIYFMQSPEAFGLPILECLCAGAQIFTPDSAWPMSWRLEEKPLIHAKGVLPDCFSVYNDEADLTRKLSILKYNFHSINTCQDVFNNFLKHYPHLYYGNKCTILDFIKHLKN